MVQVPLVLSASISVRITARHPGSWDTAEYVRGSAPEKTASKNLVCAAENDDEDTKFAMDTWTTGGVGG